MSVHTEWFSLDYLYVGLEVPGAFEDSDGNSNEDYCLILSNGDNLALDGSLDAIENLAQRILNLVAIRRSVNQEG